MSDARIIVYTQNHEILMLKKFTDAYDEARAALERNGK